MTDDQYLEDAGMLSIAQVSFGVNEDTFHAMLSRLIHETLEREFAQFLGARWFELRSGVMCGMAIRRQFTAHKGRSSSASHAISPGRSEPSLFARQLMSPTQRSWFLGEWR